MKEIRGGKRRIKEGIGGKNTKGEQKRGKKMEKSLAGESIEK